MIAALFFSIAMAREPVRIAFIDTGFDFSSRWPASYTPKVCGTYDALYMRSDRMTDEHGHGTAMAVTVAKYLNDRAVPYCFYFVKYSGLRVDSIMSSYLWLLNHPVDIVNMSYAGLEPLEYECPILEEISKRSILVAAAGNDHLNMDKYESYPASCPRVWKVMNDESVSNYVRKKKPRWVKTKDKMHKVCPNDKVCFERGTSGSAALFTAKVAERLWRSRGN